MIINSDALPWLSLSSTRYFFQTLQKIDDMERWYKKSGLYSREDGIGFLGKVGSKESVQFVKLEAKKRKALIYLSWWSTLSLS